MSKRGFSRIAGVLVSMLVLFAIFHSIAHFSFFGTGISGFYKSGVSGLAIGKTNVGEEASVYKKYSPFSRGLLVVVWGIILAFCLVIFYKNSVRAKVVHIDEDISGLRKIASGEVNTDLDVLYLLLKKRKVVPLAEISRLFGIDKEQVNEWCNILESGNLASVGYPRFGEPELRLNEIALEKQND